MDIFQTFIYIGLVYRTNIQCPSLHVQLMTDKVVRIEVNNQVDVFNFQKEVIWPGRVSVDNEGVVQIQFDKKVHEGWIKPYAARIPNMTQIPTVWSAQIVANEPLSHDTALLTYAIVNRVFNFQYPGRYMKLSHFLEGQLRNFTFPPLPMLPLRDLSYPNSPPGRFRSMAESVQLVAKSYPTSSLSAWIARRRLGALVQASNSFGDFCPCQFINKTDVYFVVTGSFIKNVASLLLWFLQSNNATNVTLVYFCRSENDILWRRDLKSVLTATERFKYTTILSHGSYLWRGWRGRPHYRWMQRFVPRGNETELDNVMVFLSGRATFLNVTLFQLVELHRYTSENVMLLEKSVLFPNNNEED